MDIELISVLYINRKAVRFRVMISGSNMQNPIWFRAIRADEDDWYARHISHVVTYKRHA